MNIVRAPAKLIEIKNSMVDSLMFIILAIGIPNLTVLIINSFHGGYFPYLSICTLTIILICTLFRRKIPFLVKAWLLITFGYFIGTLGLTHEGLLSDGLLYYVIISILSSMLINIRSGIIIMGVTILTAGIIALSMYMGWLSYSLDIIAYFRSPGTWLAFIFTVTLFTSLAVYIYGQLEKYLVQYIRELTVKTDRLNRSNIQLEKEMDERQLTEKQLVQSEIKFRNVFNIIGDGIILLDKDYAMLDINDGFVKMTGWVKESLVNHPFDTLFKDTGKLKNILSAEKPYSSIFNKNEHLLFTSDKTHTIPVEITLLPFQSNPDILYVALLKNITDTRENEIKIMNAVISSEEEERLRIAQDLHDGIGPYLSAARLYINTMEFSDMDLKAVQIKKELTELMNLSISSIREISNNLGSHVLRSLGLRAALSNYIEKAVLKNAISFELKIPDHYPFIENVEIALYRVLVELINNSIKYGSPEKISIKLTDSPDTVLVKYIENGVGFNMQDAMGKPKGMGLYNIHSRINSLGGTIDFHARPGKGVTVNVVFNRAAVCRANQG
jgi:PAS domain S-box-containing protein